jgi:DNA-nicking Smr family endonuclease
MPPLIVLTCRRRHHHPHRHRHLPPPHRLLEYRRRHPPLCCACKVKKRLPTADERKLWRESNRFTQKITDEVPDEIMTEAEASASAETSVNGRDAPLPAPPLPLKKPRSAAAAAPLAPWDGRQAARQLKARGKVNATLDLHGFSKLDAYARLQHFITRHYALGHRHLLIITGKGTVGEGVLRRAVPQWLNEPALRPMVAGMALAAPEKGGSGALHVLLKSSL